MEEKLFLWAGNFWQFSLDINRLYVSKQVWFIYRNWFQVTIHLKIDMSDSNPL